MLTNGDINYIYDGDMNNTLSNVSNDDVVVKYEYDDRKRIVKEIKIIDGISFEKTISYDSMDRITSFGVEDTINYGYGTDANLKSVGDLINVSFNANSQVSKREYDNNLDTDFTYDSENLRLAQIKTGNKQELNYSYDNVSNIVSIIDSINSRNFSMTYDYLNRLIETSIVESAITRTLNYSYNAIGNIINVIVDGANTAYVYEGDTPHAPDRIVTSGDIYTNITNPGGGERFLDKIIEIKWLINSNFMSNLLTYTIEYSNNSGSTWNNIVSNLGFINELNDSSTEYNFTLVAGGSETVYLRIPKNVTVTRVELNLKGLIG